MNVVDTAKEQVKYIAEKVVDKVHPDATESRIQAITINRSRHEVVQFFQQADRLSEIFGDVAEVHSIGSDPHSQSGPSLPYRPRNRSPMSSSSAITTNFHRRRLDPSVLITHDLPLEEGARAYDIFKNKSDGCIRVALRP